MIPPAYKKDRSPKSKDCSRYSFGRCKGGGKCIGKDHCGAYEPKSFQNGSSSEPDLHISVAHLREVLDELASVRGIVNERVDEIIDRVNLELMTTTPTKQKPRECGNCVFCFTDEGSLYYCAKEDLYTFVLPDDKACPDFTPKDKKK